MDIGNGYSVSDEWVPKGIPTCVLDVNGKIIVTADKVKLNGCTSKTAIVGKDMYGKFVLFFGGRNASVSWNLTQGISDEHKVCVL